MVPEGHDNAEFLRMLQRRIADPPGSGGRNRAPCFRFFGKQPPPLSRILTEIGLTKL